MTKGTGGVLIGPCGIETRLVLQYRLQNFDVLIGPCGIETYFQSTQISFCGVLIGPCGIETIVSLTGI